MYSVVLIHDLTDPFSLHVSFDVEPHLANLDKKTTTTSFQYHNVCTFALLVNVVKELSCSCTIVAAHCKELFTVFNILKIVSLS